jgi:hypothetical protein
MRRKRNTASVQPPSTRDHNVLAIIHSYGWLTPQMIKRVADIHGIPLPANDVYLVLNRLRKLRYVRKVKSPECSRSWEWSATPSGICYLENELGVWPCDMNMREDAIDAWHFIDINRAIIRFQEEAECASCQTTLQVRCERVHGKPYYLHYDYDGIGEFNVGNDRVVAAIQVVNWKSGVQGSANLIDAVAVEIALSFCILVVADQQTLDHLAPYYEQASDLQFSFVLAEDLEKDGLLSHGSVRRRGSWEAMTLQGLLQFFSMGVTEPYSPQFKLRLRPYPRSAKQAPKREKGLLSK